MPLITRRHLLLAAPLVLLPLVAVAVLLLAGGEDLKARSARITIGMPRDQVEGILGPPVVTLHRPPGRGEVLIWVDQLWQVSVLTGPDGRVESMEYVPSDSLLRRTMGRVVPLPR
jgi:hypothetical protein